MGGEAVVGTVLPEAQRRSVWPRAPAQRGRKRALEAEAGCWAEASGWRRLRLRPGRPPPEGRDKPDLLSDSRGWGKERGSVLLVCGREVHVLPNIGATCNPKGSAVEEAERRPHPSR